MLNEVSSSFHGKMASYVPERPTPPEGWLEDVLDRSRFDFSTKEIDGVKVFHTEDVEANKVYNSEFDKTGYLRLEFNHGHLVGIGFDKLSTAKEKDKALFIILLCRCCLQSYLEY